MALALEQKGRGLGEIAKQLASPFDDAGIDVILIEIQNLGSLRYPEANLIGAPMVRVAVDAKQHFAALS